MLALKLAVSLFFISMNQQESGPSVAQNHQASPPVAHPRQKNKPAVILWIAIGAGLLWLPPLGALIALLSKKLTNRQKYLVCGLAIIWIGVISIRVVGSALAEIEEENRKSGLAEVVSQSLPVSETVADKPSVPLDKQMATAVEADVLRVRMDNLLGKLVDKYGTGRNLSNPHFVRTARELNLEAARIFDETMTLTEKYEAGHVFSKDFGAIGHPLVTSAAFLKTAGQYLAHDPRGFFRQQISEARSSLSDLKGEIHSFRKSTEEALAAQSGTENPLSQP